MSNVIAVNAFREAVNGNPELQGPFSEAFLEGPQAVVALAARNGFVFNSEDYREALASVSESSLTPFERSLAASTEGDGGELSEYELELVSAGLQDPSTANSAPPPTGPHI